MLNDIAINAFETHFPRPCSLLILIPMLLQSARSTQLSTTTSKRVGQHYRGEWMRIKALYFQVNVLRPLRTHFRRSVSRRTHASCADQRKIIIFSAALSGLGQQRVYFYFFSSSSTTARRLVFSFPALDAMILFTVDDVGDDEATFFFLYSPLIPFITIYRIS